MDLRDAITDQTLPLDVRSALSDAQDQLDESRAVVAEAARQVGTYQALIAVLAEPWELHRAADIEVRLYDDNGDLMLRRPLTTDLAETLKAIIG